MVMKFEIPTPAGLVEKFYWCPGTVLLAVKDKAKHKVGRKTYTFGWAEVASLKAWSPPIAVHLMLPWRYPAG